MLGRIALFALVTLAVPGVAAAKCVTDIPLDAQAKAYDYNEAVELAKQAWQKRVAQTAGKGQKFDPALAAQWQENTKKDNSGTEALYIVNVSGIPCM